MNLEDRLRSHMHSGEDLFVEGGPSADDITSAGHRRTRRNQIGVAVAGGVFAIAAVFGATSMIGGSDDDLDFAAESEMLESADSEFANDSQAMDSQMFDGPIPAFDIIVGVGDGFAGLRNTDGVITAIRSTDGLTWDETSTSGIANDVQIGTLVHDGGEFAATFSTFDNSTGTQQDFIGTSTDLADWNLVQILADQQGAAVFGLAIGDGTVVSTASVFSFSGEEEDASSESSGFVIVGPVGGPYDVLPLDAVANGADRIVSVGEGYALSAFGDGAPDVSTSADGQTWTPATPADTESEFATIAALDGSLLSVGSTGFGGAGLFQIFQSGDLGTTWSPVAVPANIVDAFWWSFDVRSGDDAVAVLLIGESDEEFVNRHALIASVGGNFAEVDLTPYADPAANVTLMAVSSDEVLLQVFDAPETFDESLASSSGLVEEGTTEDLPIDEPEPANEVPRYVRVPLDQ